MKNPLHYQMTEYDCGPTTMLNAISYLFDRVDIPPDVVRNIMLYSLDSYNAKGECGKNGTSCMAMMFLSNWLNQFGKFSKFPITCQYISGETVFISRESLIASALKKGGDVVVRVQYGGWHYVLLTGLEDENILVFDPYYRKNPFTQKDIILKQDTPFQYNRIVPKSYFNCEKQSIYSLGPMETREAVLLFNDDTKITEEKTIEYFI